MADKVRLGRIQYLNVLPIYFALENLFVGNGFELVSGTPADLNAGLRQGRVDLGSISSLEYGRRFQDYYLLPDLSISSRGPVGSVLLFSRVPPAELDGRPLLVSAHSASGAGLLKVLMSELYGAQPRYRQGPVVEATTQEYDGVLAIGDEALQLQPRGSWPYLLDLGAAWQEWVGLPFVFGVWAVRRDYAAAWPEKAAALHYLLLRSRDWGLKALPELSRLAATNLGRPAAELLSYFQQLDYFLAPEHEKGLQIFFNHLYKLGELTEIPPLTYFQE
ncbi:MAG: menaquinone biosynthesis protein [Deltaproteobacteria bacterium]|nr:menaquinone biosynthesis protein [Deltaproteobacteria bacterium]